MKIKMCKIKYVYSLSIVVRSIVVGGQLSCGQLNAINCRAINCRLSIVVIYLSIYPTVTTSATGVCELFQKYS